MNMLNPYATVLKRAAILKNRAITIAKAKDAEVSVKLSFAEYAPMVIYHCQKS